MSQSLPFYKRISFQLGFPIFLYTVVAVEIIILVYQDWYTDLLIFFGIWTLIFVLYEAFAIQHYVLRPLRTLIDGVAAIESGNYDNHVGMEICNELTLLIPMIDSITKRLTTQSPEDVDKLKQVITDLNNSTKLLIQRDLELSRANEKLRDLDKMKSEFVSLATHQLRTPLSGVRWSLSMLLNGEMGELTPEQKLYVMKTYESNNRMITLINDMLQADRIDGGTIKFRFTPTNLLFLIDNILTELKPLAEKKKVELNFKATEHIPPLMIDPENMRIVLQNLIDNAIKYSKENTTVNILVGKTETDVTLSVEDHGIGIPAENQTNIFKRFFRAPNAVHTETDGSGLGLYIVESIILRHHGTIRFVSKENEGTTFYVTLPITKES